jgi:hypothetical protein
MMRFCFFDYLVAPSAGKVQVVNTSHVCAADEQAVVEVPRRGASLIP